MNAKQLTSLRKIIEEIISECITEIKEEMIGETSTTGGVAGYSTPKAFEGGKKSLRRKRATLGNSIGYLPVPNWEELEGTADPIGECNDDDELKESKAPKKSAKTKTSEKSPESQFRYMMKDARDKLIEVEKLIQSALKYKSKNKISSAKMGTLSQKSINKINSRIYSLLTKFQGMKD